MPVGSTRFDADQAAYAAYPSKWVISGGHNSTLLLSAKNEIAMDDFIEQKLKRPPRRAALFLKTLVVKIDPVSSSCAMVLEDNPQEREVME